MTADDTQRRVVDYLRHHHRGQASAIRLDDLAAALGLSRRTVEAALHAAACAGRRVGTSCVNLDGDGGAGANPRGMGAFWIVTPGDWEAAMVNLDTRFAPLAARRRGLLACRPRPGEEPVDAARRDLGRVTGEGPAVQDGTGQGLLLDPRG